MFLLFADEVVWVESVCIVTVWGLFSTSISVCLPDKCWETQGMGYHGGDPNQPLAATLTFILIFLNSFNGIQQQLHWHPEEKWKTSIFNISCFLKWSLTFLICLAMQSTLGHCPDALSFVLHFDFAESWPKETNYTHEIIVLQWLSMTQCVYYTH